MEARAVLTEKPCHGVAGHHLIDGCGVVKETIRLVAHGTHQSKLVIDLSQLRKNFSKMNSWDLGWDGIESRPNISGTSFLGSQRSK